MFNVGDEVEIIVDLPNVYPITRIGSWGIVVSAGQLGADVDFKQVHEDYSHLRGRQLYYIDNVHLALRNNKDGLTPIQRKIKRMYERQSYFLRHRSGQSAS